MPMYSFIDSVTGRNTPSYMIVNQANNINIMNDSASSNGSGTYKRPASSAYQDNSLLSRNIPGKGNLHHSVKELIKVEQSASRLRASVNMLRKTGNISEFVECYDNLLESIKNISQSTLKGSMEKLLAATKGNRELLDEIGISVNQDDMLALEESYMKINEEALGKIFDGTESYGYQLNALTTALGYDARRELSRNTAHTYNEVGGYGSNHSYNHSYVRYA